MPDDSMQNGRHCVLTGQPAIRLQGLQGFRERYDNWEPPPIGTQDPKTRSAFPDNAVEIMRSDGAGAPALPEPFFRSRAPRQQRSGQSPLTGRAGRARGHRAQPRQFAFVTGTDPIAEASGTRTAGRALAALPAPAIHARNSRRCARFTARLEATINALRNLDPRAAPICQ